MKRMTSPPAPLHLERGEFLKELKTFESKLFVTK
jgi:hypothetical protein